MIKQKNGSPRLSGRFALALFACFMFFFLAAGPGATGGSESQSGQVPAAPSSKSRSAKPDATSQSSLPVPGLTAPDLEAFLDGVMPLQLAREDIAGAVVLVVKDGRVLFAKGYGYADVAKRTPVTPDGTLFRPGSVSKLFTWTAVMQLVEAGKIDLDRDVNDYLDFKIPAKFGKPITMRNLMTHTPGFEETAEDLFVGGASDLKPLGEYLKAHLPQRVYPPGVTPAYSNYGATVAGYIVQRVSGQPFDDYIEQHIFAPLGMTHSTFRQPLPAALQPMMSDGYTVASQPAKPFEFVQAWPAGSSSVTATDISHFMIAHLQDGRYEGVQILRPQTAQLMHARAFANLPSMNAMALGFYEETRNGHRIIGHAGDTQYFHSDLHLIPDAGVGFFVSYNSAGKGEISPRTAVWHAFLDRYFPYNPPSTPSVASAAQDAATVSGRYIVSRRSETTILKVTTVLGETKVYPNSDGSISVDALKDLNGQPKKFKEIEPLVFREVNGQDKVGFKREGGGLVMVIDFPFMVFQRAPWYENSGLNLPIITCAMVVFLLTLLLWPIAALSRRHYGKQLELPPGRSRLRILVRMVCAIDLVFVIAFAVLFAIASKDIGMLSERLNPWLRFVQLIGWLGVLGTLIVLVHLVRSWADRQRGLWSKIGDALIALACVGFVWFVFTWNMLHWNLRF